MRSFTLFIDWYCGDVWYWDDTTSDDEKIYDSIVSKYQELKSEETMKQATEKILKQIIREVIGVKPKRAEWNETTQQIIYTY